MQKMMQYSAPRRQDTSKTRIFFQERDKLTKEMIEYAAVADMQMWTL